MFLRNSFLFFSIVLHFLSFSLQDQLGEKEELMVPSLEIRERVREEDNQVKVKADISRLNFQDQILICKDKEIYYYKVIEKFEKENLEEITVKDPSALIFYHENSGSTYSVLVAINTGKMVKNS